MLTVSSATMQRCTVGTETESSAITKHSSASVECVHQIRVTLPLSGIATHEILLPSNDDIIMIKKKKNC